MASSSYYRRLSSQYKAEAKEYRDQKKILQGILDDVTKQFDDNVRDVNSALGDCHDHLVGDGVRQLAAFSHTQNNLLSSVQEKYDGQDEELVALSNALRAEIRALEKKAEDADDQAREYARKAEEAAAEEAAARARAAAARAKLLGK